MYPYTRTKEKSSKDLIAGGEVNSYENRVARVSETLSICSRILLIVAASLRPWTALADGKWMGKAKMRSSLRGREAYFTDTP